MCFILSWVKTSERPNLQVPAIGVRGVVAVIKTYKSGSDAHIAETFLTIGAQTF
jgi:hypothetical protein